MIGKTYITLKLFTPRNNYDCSLGTN